jgi:hypothetical protein
MAADFGAAIGAERVELQVIADVDAVRRCLASPRRSACGSMIAL